MNKVSPSVWFDAVKSKPRYPKLQDHLPNVFDVVVVGGGIFGLTTALRLKEAGKSVAVVEADMVGGGVTGFSTAKLAALHKIVYSTISSSLMYGHQGATQYASINTAGINLVEENIRKYGIQCDFERVPNYTYTAQDKYVSTVRQEAKDAASAGLLASFTDQTELPFPVRAAVRVENEAQFNSYAYCVGLARIINDAQTPIFEDSRVTHISEAAPHTITTNEGRILGHNVVIATHIPMLDRSGHFAFMEPQCSYAMAFALNRPEQIPRSMYISVEEPTKSIRPCRDGNGETLLVVAGNGHAMGESDGIKELEELEQWTRHHWDVRELRYKWFAHDYQTVDKLPYIGYLHHGTRTMFTATGFKNGALLLAQLLL